MIVAELIDLVPSEIATLTNVSYEDASSLFEDDLPCSSLNCRDGDRSGIRWMLLNIWLHCTLLYKHEIGISP